jgi:hypothetical protein
MAVTTTLKALRDNYACVRGYNRLVRTLQGNEFTRADSERETHIRYAHKEPIPLRVILDSNDLDDALWSLRACDQTPEMVRAERLFAVWCARQVQHLMTDKRSLDALDVAERHAHGNATDQEMDTSRFAAGAASLAAARASSLAASRAAEAAASWDASRAAAWTAAWTAASDDARAAQKDMFIAVFCGDQINIDAMNGI